jgi:hypothetical protein
VAASDTRQLRPDVSPEIIWGSVGVFLLAAGTALFMLAPRLLGSVTGCVFKVGTGVPCPSCGSTRALEALAAGEMMTALAVNPLAVLAMAGSLIYLVYAWLAVAGLVRPLRPGWLTHPMPIWLRWGLPLVLAVNWVYLIVSDV